MYTLHGLNANQCIALVGDSPDTCSCHVYCYSSSQGCVSHILLMVSSWEAYCTCLATVSSMQQGGLSQERKLVSLSNEQKQCDADGNR